MNEEILAYNTMDSRSTHDIYIYIYIYIAIVWRLYVFLIALLIQGLQLFTWLIVKKLQVYTDHLYRSTTLLNGPHEFTPVHRRIKEVLLYINRIERGLAINL